MKAIFSRGRSLGLRTLVMLVLSAVMIGTSHSRAVWPQRLRLSLNVLILPIQYVVNTPIKLTHWVATSLSTEHRLLAENARLRAHDFLLQSRLQRLLALEKENGELRELLQSSSHIGGKVLVAQLLAVDLHPSIQEMIVNKGVNAHVYVGQPVLDAYGVMGQIVDVSPLTSKILLLKDTRSAIPVQNYRNGVRAVAMGTGIKGVLTLQNVPETANIKVGDLFVSSGLGLRYPVGYPVGRVIEKEPIPGEHFVQIDLQPLAHFDRTQQVLLAWPDNAALAKTVHQQLARALPGV